MMMTDQVADRCMAWMFLICLAILCFTSVSWLGHAFDFDGTRQRVKTIEASVQRIEACLNPSESEDE